VAVDADHAIEQPNARPAHLNNIVTTFRQWRTDVGFWQENGFVCYFQTLYAAVTKLKAGHYEWLSGRITENFQFS
jgi:hypothetical protein